MKIHKLKKSDLNNLTKMYERIDCVEENHAFPYYAYVSPKTYKEIEKATANLFKKQYPGITKRSLAYSVGMYLLNLGPSVLNGLLDNMILVDTKSVSKRKKEIRGDVSNDEANS